MKRNLIVILFLIHLTFSQTASRMCNKALINVFGMGGLPTPRTDSIVCPAVKNNCCSKYDELFIHKIFNKIQKGKFKARYADYSAYYKDIAELITTVSNANLNGTISYFQNVPNGDSIYKELNETYSLIKKVNTTDLLLQFNNNTQNLGRIGKQVRRAREGFYCLVCDFETSLSVDLDSNEITYSKRFCNKLKSKFHPLLYFYYHDIYNFISRVDKFVILATKSSLFDNLKDRMDILNAKNMTLECKGVGTDPNCTRFCQEFKFNEASVMYDGDMDIIKPIIKNFKALFSTLVGPNPADSAFKKRIAALKANSAASSLNVENINRRLRRVKSNRHYFEDNNRILSESPTEFNFSKKRILEEIEIPTTTYSSRTIIQSNDNESHMERQLGMMDDLLLNAKKKSLSVFGVVTNITDVFGDDKYAIIPGIVSEKQTLYKTKKIFDAMVSFRVKIADGDGGIDLIRPTDDPNFMIGVDELIPILFANEILMSQTVGDLNPQVQAILLETTKQEISAFLNEHDPPFKLYVPTPFKPFNDTQSASPRSLMSSHKMGLTSLCLFLIGVFLNNGL